MDSRQTDHFIFVYGTLKRGDCRHHAISQQRYLGDAVTQPMYRLYHLGTYPGLVEVDSDGIEVAGEVYAVDENCLQNLDEIEGVDIELYERKRVQLMEPWGNKVVETYLYLRDVSQMAQLGTSWKVEGNHFS